MAVLKKNTLLSDKGCCSILSLCTVCKAHAALTQDAVNNTSPLLLLWFPLFCQIQGAGQQLQVLRFFCHQPFIKIVDLLSFFFPFLPHIHLCTLLQEFSFSAWKLPDWRLQWIKLPLCQQNKSSTTGNLGTSSLYSPLPTSPTSKRI